MRPENMTTHVESNYDRNLDDVITQLLDARANFVTSLTLSLLPHYLYLIYCVSIYIMDGSLIPRKAVGDLTYNQLVEQICDESNYNRLLLQEFLEENVTQLTYHGLIGLMEAMQDGELAVLFRNNHFHTIHKRKDLLYLLVSDSGYVNEPSIVWESFNNVDGSSIFFASDFTVGSPRTSSATNESQGPKRCKLARKNWLDKKLKKLPLKKLQHKLSVILLLQRKDAPVMREPHTEIADRLLQIQGPKTKSAQSREHTHCLTHSHCCTQYPVRRRYLCQEIHQVQAEIFVDILPVVVVLRVISALTHHDRNMVRISRLLVCINGSCSYGTACRYDHVRPKKDAGADAANGTVSAPKPSSIPKPVKLPKPGLNTDAAEFIPSWKRSAPGISYAAAAGAIESEGALLPLCPYFEVGECTNEQCQFVHGLVCDMCSRACIHPYDEKQQKQHFAECLKQHELAMEQAFAEAKSIGKCCGICMENIMEKALRFGILEGCRHCFCLDCIREWRRNQTFETDVVRSCPECRQHSNFVIPSTLWGLKMTRRSVYCAKCTAITCHRNSANIIRDESFSRIQKAVREYIVCANDCYDYRLLSQIKGQLAMIFSEKDETKTDSGVVMELITADDFEWLSHLINVYQMDQNESVRLEGLCCISSLVDACHSLIPFLLNSRLPEVLALEFQTVDSTLTDLHLIALKLLTKIYSTDRPPPLNHFEFFDWNFFMKIIGHLKEHPSEILDYMVNFSYLIPEGIDNAVVLALGSTLNRRLKFFIDIVEHGALYKELFYENDLDVLSHVVARELGNSEVAQVRSRCMECIADGRNRSL
ncbi:hypothetical protein OSTOST_18316 [Ostertagia ostertagi]